MKKLWQDKSVKMLIVAVFLALLSGFHLEYADLHCEPPPANYTSFIPDCAELKYTFDVFSVLGNAVCAFVILEVGAAIERKYHVDRDPHTLEFISEARKDFSDRSYQEK